MTKQLLGAVCGTLIAGTLAAHDAPWRSIAIGGGGFVTGLAASTDGSAIYLRTDVGGAYRWDAPQAQWRPITDSLPNDVNNNGHLYGIGAIAVDPSNANRVFIACGKYNYSNPSGVYFCNDTRAENPQWALPDAAYRKEYGLVVDRRQDSAKAVSGKASLALSLDTAAGARKGRIDKYYGGKADWKRFSTFSLQCHVPEGAPAVTGQIAVMSGAWKWSQGAPVACPAGAWTKVSIATADIVHPEEIQLVMFIPSIAAGDFKGDLHIDKAALEGEIVVGPSKPGATLASEPSTWLETFDSAAGWERQGARVEPSPEAAVGSGAATFFLPGFITKKIAAPKPRDPDALDEGWAGISFWVKGDGSDQFGTLVLCGMHPQWFPFKYACSFPLKDTAWRQFKFRWSDLVPEDATDAIGTPGGAPPSNIEHVKVGSKWSTTHNNRAMPKFSFSLDHLQLEADLPPAAEAPARPGLDAVQAKLAGKKPVSILCLGDSITAGTSLGNADQERYAQVLERLLRERCGYDEITVVSRAVGGAQGNDLRLWVERDFTGIEPDLAIVMFGYNDKTWGYPADYYGHIVSDYVRRGGLHRGPAARVRRIQRGRCVRR